MKSTKLHGTLAIFIWHFALYEGDVFAGLNDGEIHNAQLILASISSRQSIFCLFYHS